MTTVHEVKPLNEAKAPNEQIVQMKLGRVHAADGNPREKLGNLTDMIASIRTYGILSPLVVRPTDRYGKDHVEIVFGHRRNASAPEAGLTEVPCVIRNYTDEEVEEIRLIENVQREALTALDEAEALRKLNEDRGKSIKEIAARIGKHDGYVYARIKLCALVPSAKKALQSNKISASIALRVARIDPKLQDAATEDLTRTGDIISDRAAAEILSRYQLRLAEAPFDRRDETLYAQAGSCVACPKRSGNQPSLFDDDKKTGKDTCMDPLCFEVKKDNHWKRVQEQAAAAGRKVMSEKEAKKVLTHGDAHPSSGFVDLGAVCESDSQKRTYGEIMKKHEDKLPVTIARDASGKIHELVDTDAAKPFLPRKAQEAVSEEKPNRADAGKSDDEVAKEKMNRAAYKAAGYEALQAVADKAEAKEFDKAIWLTLVQREFDVNLGDSKELCAWRDVEDVDALKKKFEKMTGAQLRGIFLQISFNGEVPAFASSGPKGKSYLESICEASRVDLKGLIEQHKKDLREEAKAKAAKPAAAKKKGDAEGASAEAE
jgi:ParB/RepB/Spo0J family partition protein